MGGRQAEAEEPREPSPGTLSMATLLIPLFMGTATERRGGAVGADAVGAGATGSTRGVYASMRGAFTSP
jgi:hypothetical protein